MGRRWGGVRVGVGGGRLAVTVLFTAVLKFATYDSSSGMGVSAMDVAAAMSAAVRNLRLANKACAFRGVGASIGASITCPLRDVRLTSKLCGIAFVNGNACSRGKASIRISMRKMRRGIAISKKSYGLRLAIRMLGANRPNFIVTRVFVPKACGRTKGRCGNSRCMHVCGGSSGILCTSKLVFVRSRFRAARGCRSMSPSVVGRTVTMNSIMTIPNDKASRPMRPKRSFVLYSGTVGRGRTGPGSVSLDGTGFR